jgi:hypothetical protein
MLAKGVREALGAVLGVWQRPRNLNTEPRELEGSEPL